MFKTSGNVEMLRAEGYNVITFRDISDPDIFLLAVSDTKGFVVSPLPGKELDIGDTTYGRKVLGVIDVPYGPKVYILGDISDEENENMAPTSQQPATPEKAGNKTTSPATVPDTAANIGKELESMKAFTMGCI